MMLVSLSLLGVVAARIGNQHQLVIGQKQSSAVAVSAKGKIKLDTMSKIFPGATGRFKKKDSEGWLHCPRILRSNKNSAASCRFVAKPGAANVWKMNRRGVIDDVQQYQFVDVDSGRCLMRQSCHSGASMMSLGDSTRYWDSDKNCEHCGTRHWSYNARAFKLSEHTERNCVQHDGRIKHCTDGYQKLIWHPGRYVPPVVRSTFECISQSEAVAEREMATKSEHEDAILDFETQMDTLAKKAKDAKATSDKFGIATAILNVGSSVVGAIPIVGGVASFLTKAAGTATACAAAAADAAAEEARDMSQHKHLDKLEAVFKLGVNELKSLLLKIKTEHDDDVVAMQIAAISQNYLDMEVAATEIESFRWEPEDLMDYPTEIKNAFGQIRITYETAREVNQFVSSLHECVVESDGRLVEKPASKRKVETMKLKLDSAVSKLEAQLSALRTLRALCKQNKQTRARDEEYRRDQALQQQRREAQRKVDEARYAENQRVAKKKEQHDQDTLGFASNEYVDCSRYTFIAECKDVKTNQADCEGSGSKPGRCSNRHGIFGEKTQRYRCRWSAEHGCRSTKGKSADQKCRPKTCKKPSE